MNPKQANPSRSGVPSILLAEDDEVSREFLLDALRRLPANVTAVTDGAQARRRLLEARFDLVLLDRGLPALDASAIRRAVRSAAGPNAATPMLALSADVDPVLREQFRTQGFIDLLAKPITAAALRSAVRAALPGAMRDWDDEQALAAANGNRDIVDRLRQLMCQDLPEQRNRLLQSVETRDFAAAHDLLHRMKAACAFCGATRLAAACSALDDALREAPADEALRALLGEFSEACESALADAN